ncbi:MAG: hypothetical protein WAN87_05305 [Thermoplasmata archaeon]
MQSPGEIPASIETEAMSTPGTQSSVESQSISAAARPRRVLLALSLSLVGFLLVAVLIYSTKYLGAGPTVFDLPSRDLWVLGLMLAVSPLLFAVFHRVSIVFLLPGIALIFLLYPLFSPFGLPYDRDVVYNFQFASVLLQTGHWVPGGPNFTGQASDYSLYPGSGVYNAEFASATGIPLVTSIQWSIPIFRLLVLPPVVYTIGKRLFSPRVGMLSLLLFMGIPSILFNISVQQEFAVPFFALTFLLLAYVVLEPEIWSSAVFILLVLFSSFIVISHALTSYVTLAWLGGFLLVAFLLARQEKIRWSRVAPIFVTYLATFVVYTYFFTATLFEFQLGQLETNARAILATSPASATPAAAGVGLSFPLYQQAWSYGAFLFIVVLGIVGLLAFRRSKQWSFIGINVVLALILTLATIPFLATDFSFLVQRVLEWTSFFLLPLVAWWLLDQLWPHVTRSPSEGNQSSRRSSPNWRRYVGPVAAIAIVVLIFTGGSLVPYSSRDQFAPTSQIEDDSPVLINGNDYAVAVWAHTHLNRSVMVWGDYFTYAVLGGFGAFNVGWDGYLPFNGTTVSESAWALLKVGQYIVVDQYMTTKTPEFYGPADDQPTGPLNEAQITKFNNPTYFDRVFDNSRFTIYMVIQLI